MTLRLKLRCGGSRGGGRLPYAVRLCALTLAAALAGCRNQDAPPETLKPIEVGPVELYGVSLGANATPQQVTCALMQALRDTVKVSQAHKRNEAKKGIETELQLCAPARIQRNVLGGTPGAESLTARQRDAIVYRIVKLWAPIAAHYVDSFNTDSAKAIAAMRVRPVDKTDVRVSYDVTDPVDRTKVTFQVYLTQEAGSQPGHDKERFWRVYRLGYAQFGSDEAVTKPASTRRAATQPTIRAATTNANP